MFVFIRWVRFLYFLSLFSLSTNTYAHFKKEATPLNHIYIHELLERVQQVQLQGKDFHSSMQQLSLCWDHTGLPVAGNICLSLPFMLLEGGINGKIDNEEILAHCKPASDVYSSLLFKKRTNNNIKNSLRGNLVLGNLYRYPFYFRVGYDYIPFGYHVFEALQPQSTITRGLLRVKKILAEVGGGLSSPNYQMRGAFAFLANVFNDNSILIHFQYERKKPTQIEDFLTIGRYITGGGATRKFFNLYSHIHFSKSFSFRSECHIRWHEMWNTLPDTVHAEIEKRFKQIPMIGLHVPWSLVVGYERGFLYVLDLMPEQVISKNASIKTCYDAEKQKEGFFGALKLSFCKKRITVLGGLQYNLIANTFEESLKPFFMIGVSL